MIPWLQMKNLNVAEISDAHVTETGVGRVPLSLPISLIASPSDQSRRNRTPLRRSIHFTKKKKPPTGKECVELRLRPKFIPADPICKTTSLLSSKFYGGAAGKLDDCEEGNLTISCMQIVTCKSEMTAFLFSTKHRKSHCQELK